MLLIFLINDHPPPFSWLDSSVLLEPEDSLLTLKEHLNTIIFL